MNEFMWEDPTIHKGALLYDVQVELTSKPYPEYDEYRLLAEAVVAIGERNKRIERQTRLLADAHLDPVTLLPNRAAFEADLASAEQRAHRSSSGYEPFAVVIVDTDGLKLVNDQLGHDEGDRLLRVTAERLDGTMRNFDRAYRIGGDEFAILMPNIRWSENETEDDAAYGIQLRTKRVVNFGIQAAKFPEQLHAGASVGVAISRAHESSKDTVGRADSAMYQAKRNTKRNLRRRGIEFRDDRLVS